MLASEVIMMRSDAPFSEVLRQQRRAAGYSQEELAQRAGLSAAAIGSLEQGLRRAPHRDTVRLLADALSASESMRRQLEEAAARARGRQPRSDAGLPASLTSYIERGELDELKALLHERRLLTITGSPGIGKTRIAIELARRVEDRYEETWFVDLLPVRGANLVAEQIALRLGVWADDDDSVAKITHRIRSRHVLLVIDNCEHVVADVASVAEVLLRSCPLLTVLATSREALALSGELGYRLPSMDAIVASDLFVARVQQSEPAWLVNAERLAVVGDICKNLDGIPLAIELAASRVPTLGLEALRARLKGGITLMGGRDLPARHRTMNATIAWSYNLLSDVEALLFRRLSVFVGGFTLEAAEHLISSDTIPAPATADAVSNVVQKSLINVDHVGTSVRYHFLESIRTFALERLVHEDDLESTMLRLIGWLDQKAAAFDSAPAPKPMAESCSELDNVRSAVTWAVSSANYDTIVSAARIVTRFGLAWYWGNRHSDARALGLALLDCLDERQSPETVGLLILCISPTLKGVELLRLAPLAIPLLDANGKPEYAAYLHVRIAEIECSRGNAVSAKTHLASAAALLSTPELRRTPSGLAVGMTSAYVCCQLYDFSGARACLEQIEIPPGSRFEIDVHIILAQIEFREGNPQKAIDRLQQSELDLDRHPSGHLLVSANLAEYLLSVEDRRGSEDALRKAVDLILTRRHFGILYVAATCARYAAAFTAQSGNAELAVRLLAACDAADERGGHISERNTLPYAMAVAAIAERLSPDQIERLRVQGAAQDVYALLEEFLERSLRDSDKFSHKC